MVDSKATTTKNFNLEYMVLDIFNKNLSYNVKESFKTKQTNKEKNQTGGPTSLY